MDTKQLIESRLAQMSAERDRLTESWKNEIGAVEKFYAKQGKSLTNHDRRNIARVCENTLMETAFKSKSKIFEAGTTDTSNVDFLGIYELCAI